jgi:hypothetical protein
VKTTFALWIVSILFTTGGRQVQQPFRWIATATAHEQLQIGPLEFEIRLQRSNRTDSEEFDWPISGPGINTDLAASLEPLSIRIVVVLNMGDRRAGLGAAALLRLNSRGPLA